MSDPTTEFEYKPERLTEGVPLYFVRTWGGADDQPGEETYEVFGQKADFVLDTRTYFPQKPLTIYGYSIVSQYEEDKATAWRIWRQRKGFLSYCYSEIVPQGEMGFTDATDVVEISRDQFMEAKERGWVYK